MYTQSLRSLSSKKLTNSKCLMKTTSIYYFGMEDSTLESHALATQVYGLQLESPSSHQITFLAQIQLEASSSLVTLTKACSNLIYQARTIKGLCVFDSFGVGVHVLSNKTPHHFCSSKEQRLKKMNLQLPPKRMNQCTSKNH